jgi:hypothetical protein
MSHDTTTHAAVPGQVLDLSRWYLTLPTEAPNHHGRAEDISQPRLANFFDDHFRVRDGAVEYVAPVVGFTTPRSHATRSELRQLTGPDKDHPKDWKINSGTHTLTCTLTCDATGASPDKKCIVGQIHDADGTPPIYLAVEVDGDSARLNAYLRGTSPHRNTLPLDGLQPDTVFSYRIQVKGGRCRVWVARGDVDALPSDPTKTYDKDQLGDPGKCYFKAGAYNKSEVAHGSGKVVVRHLWLEVS